MVTKPQDSTPPAQGWVMGRALISAAVFGYIGKTIGHRLGRNLSNTIAEPALKWSMGAFWALLAAYSSLKASAISNEAAAELPTTPAIADAHKAADVQMEPKVKVPLSLIEVDTLKDHGQLQEAPQLQRT